MLDSSSSKDLAFTLFGRKIPLSDDGEAPAIHSHADFPSSDKLPQPEKDETLEDDYEKLVDDDDSDDSRNQETSVNPKTPSIDEEISKPAMNGKSESEKENPNSEKTLKKPDKLLPCPRCKSMDTKFCYFNNYNVNQPRHFCKACQRYWTAGGTMRNVPVGAGRRKSKNSASYYRHITMSEALEAARIENSNGTHKPDFVSNNGRILNFNLEAQNSDSVVSSVLNLAENRVFNNGGEKGSELGGCDNKSSSESSQIQKINGFPSQISYLSGVPWPFIWNSSVPPGFPMSFFPAAAWTCGVSGPWFSPQPEKSMCSDSNLPSSTLGKHQRENEISKEDGISSKEEGFKHRNGCVLTPKTLRIDDPSEAAKSSIWATLGIKNESMNGAKNMFKPFQPKGHEKIHVTETSSVLLQANPAALSRSLIFHESS